mmetsp:Transcript_12669/g.23686  ORF Transcript_12669/g.23686 Transcript_12669/m.23686 type:complete len:154 (+) Transcript_12669:232-693(+)
MSEWFDPRLTVFIIWGFFVMLFICIPSKRIIARLLYRMGFPCCRGIVEADEARERERRTRDGVDYEHLSPARKHEIDSNRSIALLHYLSRFTLVSRLRMLRTIISLSSIMLTCSINIHSCVAKFPCYQDIEETSHGTATLGFSPSNRLDKQYK